MKNILLLLLLNSTFIFSQDIVVPVDTIVKTFHETTIKGKKIKYTAETGMQPVWDNDGKPIASLFYTYYKRNLPKDSKVKESHRPIIISFNGGPGSGSLWMHIGYTGPRVLKIDDEGFPIQPYGMKTNPYSIIDTADIVFVCPVNTGYSRMLADKKGNYPDRKKFLALTQTLNI